jgi:pathogenesis-related protein 1
MKHYSWVALAIANTTTVMLCAAQNSQLDFVSLHNEARVPVGVGPVTWDNNMWQPTCIATRRSARAIARSYTQAGPTVRTSSVAPPAADAMGSWVSENQYYVHASNSCAWGQMCAHNTQVVWHASTAIGCASVGCDNGGTFIICSYNPPGNFFGQSPY